MYFKEDKIAKLTTLFYAIIQKCSKSTNSTFLKIQIQSYRFIVPNCAFFLGHRDETISVKYKKCTFKNKPQQPVLKY